MTISYEFLQADIQKRMIDRFISPWRCIPSPKPNSTNVWKTLYKFTTNFPNHKMLMIVMIVCWNSPTFFHSEVMREQASLSKVATYLYLFLWHLPKVTNIVFKVYVLSIHAFPGDQTHDSGATSGMLHCLSSVLILCMNKSICLCMWDYNFESLSQSQSCKLADTMIWWINTSQHCYRFLCCLPEGDNVLSWWKWYCSNTDKRWKPLHVWIAWYINHKS